MRTQYIKDLSNEEQKLSETATLNNLFDRITAAQKEHEAKSHSRHISRKLEPLVSAVSQYGTVPDIYASTYGEELEFFFMYEPISSIYIELCNLLSLNLC